MSRSTLQSCGLPFAAAIALLIGLIVFVQVLDAPRGYDWKEARAQLGCTGLAQAIEAYVDHKANTKHELPRSLSDLVNPPFGAPSFLRDGSTALIDPWGKPYQMELIKRPDESEFILVSTTSPSGTPISQFGIGKNNAFPQFPEPSEKKI